MKKQYTKLKIKLVTLTTMILFIGCIVLTYQKADEIMTDYLAQIDAEESFIADIRRNVGVEGNVENIEQQAYNAFDDVGRIPDVGFYSMLKDSKGNTLAEDQYYIIVEQGVEEKERRTILLGDHFFTDNEDVQIQFSYGANRIISTDENGVKTEFAHGSFSRVEIYGTCDSTFIYPEKIVFQYDVGGESGSYTYIPEEDFTEKGDMKVEEWAGGNVYDVEELKNSDFLILNNSVSFIYTDWNESEKLNAEAKEICERIYEDMLNDKDQEYGVIEGLFTCYVTNNGRLSGEYYMPYAFVFHPVSLAIKEIYAFYMGAFLFGIIVNVILCILVNRVYKQQLAYEMNRRELTRGIAHELKTPIAIVKGYVENWKYMDEDNKEKCSQTMIDEMNHMNTMVTDLLELSRLEAKAKEMHTESVDIHSLAKSVLGRMKEMISEKGLQVTITPENGEFLVNADLEMMRTVLVNFITNAVKYADKVIDISITENAKKIKFSITNDGKNIDAANLQKVWDEFYRAGYANDHNMGSSGLGLAITKNILILHDAKYGCDSKDGRTVFWFEMKKCTE